MQNFAALAAAFDRPNEKQPLTQSLIEFVEKARTNLNPNRRSNRKRDFINMASDQCKLAACHRTSPQSTLAISSSDEPYWNSARIKNLGNYVSSLRKQFKNEKWPADISFYHQEKKLFLEQLEVSIAVYDALIPKLDHITNNIAFYGIPLLVEQALIPSYLEDLASLINALKVIGSGWYELYKAWGKRQELKDVSTLTNQLTLNNGFILDSIRELAVYLSAAHNAHMNTPSHPREGI